LPRRVVSRADLRQSTRSELPAQVSLSPQWA
jgi:hypothetical protein